MVYQGIVGEAKHKHDLQKADRFAKISQREEKCDLPKSAWEKILKNTHSQSWKGIICAKGPMEIAIYNMLLYELQPKTIIEIGSLNGGSAVWFADCLEIMGIQGKVYGVDSVWYSFYTVKKTKPVVVNQYWLMDLRLLKTFKNKLLKFIEF